MVVAVIVYIVSIVIEADEGWVEFSFEFVFGNVDWYVF